MVERNAASKAATVTALLDLSALDAVFVTAVTITLCAVWWFCVRHGGTS
jgi:hypothetical protein